MPDLIENEEKEDMKSENLDVAWKDRGNVVLTT